MNKVNIITEVIADKAQEINIDYGDLMICLAINYIVLADSFSQGDKDIIDSFEMVLKRYRKVGDNNDE